MKQQIKKKFYVYLFFLLIISMKNIICNVQDVEICEESFEDECIFEIYTTLRIIDQMRYNIEEYDQNVFYSPVNTDNNHQDFMVEIIGLLLAMYGKIIEATVTHYLIGELPLDKNGYEAIIKIIATDSIVIMQVTGKHLFLFLSDSNISWQEKVYRCAFVFGIVLIIKVGMDSMPDMIKKYVKPSDIKPRDNQNNVNVTFESNIVPEDSGSFSNLFGVYR